MELKQTLIYVAAILFLITSNIKADTNDNKINDDNNGGDRGPRLDFEDLLDDEDYVGDDDVIPEKAAPAPVGTPTADFGAGQEVIEEPTRQSVAPCLGCPIKIDPTNEKVNDLAQFAFQEYLTTDVDEGQEKILVRVIKAETQVVAGVKYMLDLEIGWTNCTKKVGADGAAAELLNEQPICTKDESKPTFICQFNIVEKSWLNSKEVVHSKCLREEEEEPKPANSESTYAFDYDSLDDDVIPMPPTVDSETAAHDSSSYDYEARRKKRDTTNLGNLRDIKEGKDVIEDIAHFALSEMDRIDEDNNARILVEVLTAKKQTVSGWLYHLKLQVAPSTCEEGSHATLLACQDKITLPLLICDVKVLLQPWQTVQKKLTQGECVPMKYKKSKKIVKKLFDNDINEVYKKKRNFGDENGPLIGGRVVIDPNSEELNELVDFAIDSVDAQSNALHAQKLVRVVYADRQLVSGILTNMVIEIGYTTCRKSRELDKSQCELDETRTHQYCNITIYEKPWLQSKTVQASKCGKGEDMMNTIRSKRGIDMFLIPEFPVIPESSDVDVDQHEFGKFIEKYNKNYESEVEYGKRLAIFKDNMKKVRLLQANEQGTATYGATLFADLTEEEFTQHHLGLRTDLRQRMKRKIAKVPVVANLPDEFDWRHYNIVTPVKNQGMCGSCWAFSVTGNIEGLYALKHAQLQSFSEQELVDCDTLDEGCNGGLPENAYKALEKMGGLETEQQYPYEGKGEKCHFSKQLARAQVTGFVELPKNETEMAAWLVKNGPISIGINANAMQFYFGGVSHPWKFLCSPKNLDHGVLIVGYGVHTTSIRHKVLPYWIIKNSWGNWGEHGYYRVYRGDGTCGVNQMATSAVIA